MSTTTILPTPALTAGTSSTTGLWARLWASFEAHGHRRAAAELRRLALIHPVGDAALREQMLAMARRAEDAAR